MHQRSQRTTGLFPALHSQGKYDEAKPLYERAVATTETNLGKEHQSCSTYLNNLAGLLQEQVRATMLDAVPFAACVVHIYLARTG